MRWLVLALTACGGAASDSNPDASTCYGFDSTPIGCSDNATLEVVYTGDEAQLANATGRVCRNSLCSQGNVPSIPSDSSGGYGNPLSGELQVTLTAWRETGIRFVAGTREDSALFVDGDTYSLSIRAADGTELAARNWTATYTYLWGTAQCHNLCMHAELTPVP